MMFCREEKREDTRIYRKRKRMDVFMAGKRDDIYRK
jgi:hypothetical protein